MKGLLQHRRPSGLQHVPSSTDVLPVPLLQLTPVDALRVGDVVQNISVTGQPGSGKTSSMATLAKALLLSGASLLVFCAKSDERDTWQRYCQETGRLDSLIVIDGKQHRYNFIAAQLARYGLDGINNVIDALLYVLEVRGGSENLNSGMSGSPA